MTGKFVKRYPDGSARRRAENHYRWLAGLGSPLLLPELCAATRLDLCFEHIDGRHARPADLTMLAAHLGDVHGTAYSWELHDARLGRPFRAAGGYLMPSFPEGRADAVERELRSGHVPDAALTVDQAQRLLTSADGPAAFYKDANPRNFLVTPIGNLVTIDVDDLTLAPFGYDLAKLVVSLAMTYGPLPAPIVTNALTAYNTATAAHGRALPGVAWDELMNWAEIHHILTSRYAADGRYAYQWNEVRLSTQPTGEPTWP
jgi:Ser/Thr protein kinase RdoA (MazF antagonist)